MSFAEEKTMIYSMNIGKIFEIPIKQDLKIHISIYIMNCTEDISMRGILWR